MTVCVDCKERPATYLQQFCEPCYVLRHPGSPAIAQHGQPRSGRLVLTRASDVTPELIEWLWTDRLPLRDLAVLAGEPGLGKSTTTTQLAADVTLGKLDGELHGQPRTVLIASAEDHFESVIWGRLKAAGADLTRVMNVTTSDGMLSVPGDVEAIAAECRRLRDDGEPVALIVVDPISAYLGGIDSHKDAAVRTALAPLADLAHGERVAVLVVAHLNKSAVGPLQSRITGSGAFGAAPRSVLVFVRDPDDPDGDHGNARVLVHVKSNHGRYAPTLMAHIAPVMVPEVGSTVSTLVIDGETELGPEDLQGGSSSSSRETIREALIEALSGGRRKAGEVVTEVMAQCSASDSTVRRVAKALERDGDLVAEWAGQHGLRFWSLTEVGQPNLVTPDQVHVTNFKNPTTTGAAGREALNLVTPEKVTKLEPNAAEWMRQRPGESFEEWDGRTTAEFSGGG
jgi:hypothetical protein